MAAPVLTTGQMRQWEQACWAEGISEREVIATVGRLVAERVLRATAPGDAILILAGKGHNGDDARAAAGHLSERRVRLVDIADPGLSLNSVEQALAAEPALVVDGLFGIGLNRPLSPDWISLLSLVNASSIPVVAIDAPSGLNAESGEPEGAALKASVTLMVGAPKAGLLKASAGEYTGRLELLPEIGLPRRLAPTESDLAWLLEEDFKNYPRRRLAGSHKGSFGHLVIYAGSLGYHGAAVLAARGAERAQPGLITVVTAPDVYVPVASQLCQAMVRPWELPWPVPDNCTGILFGPGLAAPNIPEAMKVQLREIWRNFPHPVVADASALAELPPDEDGDGLMRVLTPHPGEAARLLGVASKDIQADRPKAVRQLSSRHGGAWVVLKGQQSLIGSAEGPILVNSTGNPILAQGGSGDLLAGFLAGLLAQPELQKNAEKTIAYAVWKHGSAGDALAEKKQRGTIEELAAELG